MEWEGLQLIHSIDEPPICALSQAVGMRPSLGPGSDCLAASSILNQGARAEANVFV